MVVCFKLERNVIQPASCITKPTKILKTNKWLRKALVTEHYVRLVNRNQPQHMYVVNTT